VAYSELPEGVDGAELEAGELGAAADAAAGAEACAFPELSVFAAGVLASAGFASEPESDAGSLAFAA
jgi:hypothetical protein